MKWTPSQGQFLSWVKVYFSLFFIVLFTLPSWQLLFPNKSLQAFFLPEIDVVSQNCKTQNNPLTLRVIPEQFQTPPGISFRTLLTSISVLWRCYPYSALYRPYWFGRVWLCYFGITSLWCTYNSFWINWRRDRFYKTIGLKFSF